MARLVTIDLDWLEAEIEDAETKIKVFKEGHVLRHIQEAICGKLHEVRSKCTPTEEPKVEFSSEYHPKSFLKSLATSNGNYIKLLCSDMIKHWNNHYGDSMMERFKHRAFGKGYKLTLVTGGWSGNEDLVNAIKMNPISQLCYIKWESSGIHEFFINPNTFGYYTQSDLARKLGVSRQYVNSNKGDYKTMRICGTEYLKIPPTGKTIVR